MGMDVETYTTPTDPATGTRTINPVPVNFAADYRVVSEKPGEVVLTNISAPLGSPQSVRISFSEIADVFKGTPVEVPAEADSLNARQKAGMSLLVQVTGCAVSGEVQQFPYSAHLVLKLPYGPEPGYADVIDLVELLLGTLYETGLTTAETRLDSLMHGSLTPPDL
jgi:hypothetical protein